MFPPDPSVTRAPAECRLQILLIEDHPMLSNTLCRFLERRRHLVHRVGDLESARALLADNEFDVLLTNVELPDGECFELFEESAERLPRFIVTMSGFDGAVRAGRSHHFCKPFPVEELEALLKRFASELQPADVARQEAAIPSLVEAVLREVARRHHRGDLSDGEFADKLNRLRREELANRGLELVVRPVEWGTRFLIKQARKGRVYDMIDCPSRSS
jgi:DNA-binding response OmpR family regulator